MIIIPGFIITIVTFPGFIMQTVARRFWCDVLGIPVYEANYFKGTIVHERIENPWRVILIACAPFSVNSLLCAILFFPVAFSVFLDSTMSDLDAAVNSLLAWSGIAIGMHALPSRASVKQYLEYIPEPSRHGIGYFTLRSVSILFLFADLLKRVWFDLIYAVGVGLLTPYLVTWVCMAL